MFGTKKIDTTIRTRADHLAEMRQAIDKATSAAEDAGVFAREIRDVFEGGLNLWRQRALAQADMANRDRPRTRRRCCGDAGKAPRSRTAGQHARVAGVR